MKNNFRTVNTCKNCKFVIADIHPDSYEVYCNLDGTYKNAYLDWGWESRNGIDNDFALNETFPWTHKHRVGLITICDDYSKEKIK